MIKLGYRLDCVIPYIGHLLGLWPSAMLPPSPLLAKNALAFFGRFGIFSAILQGA